MSIKRVVVFVGMVFVASAAFGQCRDPWVTEELKALKGRIVGSGENGECNINLYGRSWNSRDELRGQIRQAFANLKEARLEFHSENLMNDLMFHGKVYANAGNIYVGPAGNSPYADQAQTKGGTYWWHIPMPKGHVLVVARKCRRGWTSTGGGSTGGCVR